MNKYCSTLVASIPMCYTSCMFVVDVALMYTDKAASYVNAKPGRSVSQHLFYSCIPMYTCMYDVNNPSPIHVTTLKY